jgi:hypothetical protein
MACERRQVASLSTCARVGERKQKGMGCPMKNIIVMTVVAFAASGGVSSVQTVVQGAQTAPASQEQTAPIANPTPAARGLSDLDAMTFGCPKAALNAAAREAAKVPSEGTYQFASLKIKNDSHHASYEIHFKSNYAGEAELKYCVALYCQQGWDPATTKPSVKLMAKAQQPGSGVAHEASCSERKTPVKPRRKR